MRDFRLTPEQARAVGAQLARVSEWFRQFCEQLQAVAQRLAEALQPLARAVEQLRPVLDRPDRPAWASPYGPPPRRH